MKDRTKCIAFLYICVMLLFLALLSFPSFPGEEPTLAIAVYCGLLLGWILLLCRLKLAWWFLLSSSSGLFVYNCTDLSYLSSEFVSFWLTQQIMFAVFYVGAIIVLASDPPWRWQAPAPKQTLG